MAKEFKPCSIDGCNDVSVCRGYCNNHYNRWRRHHGDPLGGNITPGTARKFYDEIARAYEGDECLFWPYSKDKDGYAQIQVGKEKKRAHRLLCEEIHGTPPTPEHVAAHSCGKGHLGCVNKRHLSWKTQQENTDDKLIHGTLLRGERHPSAKLTASEVREIRVLKGQISYTAMAKLYGVTHGAIDHIFSGRTWKNLS